MKNSQKIWTAWKSWTLTAAFASFIALGAGCGKQAYVVTDSASAQQAPGSFSVPAKVDILLVQDDTGSSLPIFDNIKSQLATFLTQLQTEGWDFHLATIPLTTYRAVQQVQASQYDPNWGSQWKTPYPGAQTSQIETVSSDAFRFPQDYQDFLGGGSAASQGEEIGLHNLRAMLQDPSMRTTGFLRPDALLAVVLLSTGDDTSERNFCYGSYQGTDGREASCDLIRAARNGTNPSLVCGTPGANPSPYCNNYEASLLPYKTFMKNVKGIGKSAQVRFYSIVSAQHQVTGGRCMGTNAFQGARYHDLAAALNGVSFDICTTPIPSVLDSIAADLSTVQLDLYTSYLFIAEKPNPTSITVWRNPGGNAAQRVRIPQDATNGWTYADFVTHVFTTAIGSPSATPTLNQGSGYAVQLHGTGIIGGSDTATVEFLPDGAQNSAAH